jgi:hypothetical protein
LFKPRRVPRRAECLKVEDGRVSSHVEQVLARAAVSSALALCEREVSAAMLDDNTLA